VLASMQEGLSMGTVPLHAALVHVPLGLAAVLPLLAAALALASWRRLVPRGAWAVVVALEVLLVLGSAAAMRSGERDEDVVERITGGDVVEAHERAAQTFLAAASLALAVAIGTLVVPARAVPAVAAAAALGTFVVAGLAYRTGKAGGEIVYARGGAAAFTRPDATAPHHAGVTATHRSRHRHND
jgi:hypothetical protein